MSPETPATKSEVEPSIACGQWKESCVGIASKFVRFFQAPWVIYTRPFAVSTNSYGLYRCCLDVLFWCKNLDRSRSPSTVEVFLKHRVWQDLQPKETTRPISSTEFQVFHGHDGSAEVEACRACHVIGVDWAVFFPAFPAFYVSVHGEWRCDMMAFSDHVRSHVLHVLVSLAWLLSFLVAQTSAKTCHFDFVYHFFVNSYTHFVSRNSSNVKDVRAVWALWWCTQRFAARDKGWLSKLATSLHGARADCIWTLHWWNWWVATCVAKLQVPYVSNQGAGSCHDSALAQDGKVPQCETLERARLWAYGVTPGSSCPWMSALLPCRSAVNWWRN